MPNTRSKNLESQLATLETLKQMCDELKPSGNCGCDVQVKALLKIMCAQLAEIKGTVLEVKAGLERVDKSCQDAVVVSEKAHQYSRRNTVVLSGLELEEGETSVQLEGKVAGILSDSGTAVKVSDFNHCYRNSRKDKIIKNREGVEIKIPPTVTVVFQKGSKKDDVLRGYKNFDTASRKRKKVTLYQSLSPYYNKLRKEMSDFLHNNTAKFEKCIWIHWRSSSAGFCLKTEKCYLSGIFSFDDFRSGLASHGC